MSRQIIATSFGLDKYTYQDINKYFSYIEGKVAKDIIKICYIGIASEDSLIKRFFLKGYIYLTYPKWEIYTLTREDITDEIKTNIIYECDLIFVGDGKTFNLIEIFYTTRFADKLKKAYEQGIIMGGVGSGLICWFKEAVDTDDVIDNFGKLSIIGGLNFLPFSGISHYQIEERKQMYQTLVKENKLVSGYGVPDGSIVHFINETFIGTIDIRDKVEWIFR